MIRHNIGYKLLALLIAILVWAYVSRYADQGRSVSRVTREVSVAVNVHNPDAGLVVTPMTDTVKVRLEGPKKYIETIIAEPDSVTANVYLSDKREGEHRLPVIVKLATGYTGLVSAEPNPSRVTITARRLTRKTLKIEVEFAASPPIGFRFAEPRITPSQAAVSGMSERVKSVVRLALMVDPESAKAGAIEADLPVKALDASGKEVRNIRINPEKAGVRLEIESAPVSKVVFVSPITSGRPPYPHKVLDIEVKPQSVTLTGRPERLMEISTVSTEPVSLDHHTETFSKRVNLAAPAGTTLANGRPATVTVRIGAAEPAPEETD